MMKKLLFAALLTFAFGIAGSAQQLNFGVKAGANLSTMNVDGESTRTGLNGGIFAQLRVANIAIQPELLYSTQGAMYDYWTQWDDMILKYTGKVRTGYISIPVMLQYYIVPGLSIEAGPQVSFLMSAKNKPDSYESKDMKDNMKKTDFAVNFGVSYKLPMVPLGFYARYSLGLTDVFEKDNYEVFEGESGKNRVIQFGAFVRF